MVRHAPIRIRCSLDLVSHYALLGRRFCRDHFFRQSCNIMSLSLELTNGLAPFNTRDGYAANISLRAGRLPNYQAMAR